MIKVIALSALLSLALVATGFVFGVEYIYFKNSEVCFNE